MEQGIRIRTVIILWILIYAVSHSNAQDYSTWDEIYDYDVGDIFHQEEYANSHDGGYIRYKNIQVIEKEYSFNGDTVSYLMWVDEAYDEWSDKNNSNLPLKEWGYSSYYQTEKYYNLDSVFYADSVYYSSNYNGRKISYLLNSFSPMFESWSIYVDGCGRVEYYRLNKVIGEEWEEMKHLVYFKKGIEEWGTPNPIVHLGEWNEEECTVLSYPNPFTISTTIEYELTEPTYIQLTIYNHLGEAIKETVRAFKSPGVHTYVWSAEKLSEGMYFAVLRSGDGVSVVKLIKQ